MTRTVPIILVVLLAAGIFLADPARRARAMIAPSSIPAGLRELPSDIPGWRADDLREPLPRAYPPHNAVWEASARYIADAPGSASVAYFRIVIAQDRRDLMAFDPTHAMRAGGWELVGATSTEGLRQTEHARRAGLLSERVVLETAYVEPGRWGPMPRTYDRAAGVDPGWPGPGAMVQVLVTAPVEGNALSLRAWVRERAGQLADELARVVVP